MERQPFIQSLRDLADWLDAHPDVPTPDSVQLHTLVRTKDELRAVAKASPAWAKLYFGEYMALRHTVGTIEYDINIARSEVCRKVVTGTKVVPAQPETTVEDFEWVCDDPILSHGAREGF